MARTYKRDKNGRFSSTGGAKAAYKNARSNARAEARTAQEFPTPALKKRAASAQASLTKLTKSMHGGTAGNIGRTKKDDANTARQGLAGIYGKSRADKAAARKAAAPKKAASRKPSFKPRGRSAVPASDVSKSDASARLSAGRRLKGSGKNPTARAERNLERGMTGTGRKARRSEATAARAIDYLAKTGQLGKRSNGTKKRK